MKRITLTIALLLGGASAAHAQAPGQIEPGPAPTPYGPYAQPDAGPGERMGPRGPGERMGPRGRGAMMRGQRGQRAQRLQHRLPPQLRAKLVAMFDRDQDGRLDQRERRAAKRFVKRLARHRHQARQGGGF